MCGILVTSATGKPFSHSDLASLRARGPDSIGFWCDRRVNMAQTRLAIIGLDESGTGPIEDDRHVLAFNGEIYNFLEIRRRLETEGIDLAGANDARVLLAAWTRWGADILPDLAGFWAFVVYDKLSGQLTLVRDQLGVKPLYFALSPEGFYAASMLRTVLEVSHLSPDLDYEAMSEYAAYQMTFGTKTFVRQIRKVPPGSVVVVDPAAGTASTTVYEDILAPPSNMLCDLGSGWIEESRRLLTECVLESTVSDVPYATLCSGGLDSSVLTRIAAPDIAYHCNYSDPDCNETFFARRVVEGTATRLLVVNASESFDLVGKLQDIVEDFDDLSIGSVILPLDDLLGLVKRRYKVILTGTGGDELFGGYTRYQLALGECYQDSYKALFETLRPLTSVADRFEACHRKGHTEYFRFFEPDVENTFRKEYDACRMSDDEGHAMLTFDRRHFLPGLLNIDDKMSARHSLESRPSLLHQRFVRHVNGLSPSVLLGNVELKEVFRRIAEPLLPPAVTRRTDKMGFTTPIGTFVQHSADRIREQLTRSSFSDLYDLRRLHLGAQDKFSRQVFGLLMVDIWLNRYLG
jgi:asparagine synthase (glutamine-hydrolysing)